MDIWKFYDITHREHLICNPTSDGKLTRLVELLRLPADARVVDIACGKGEFLIRLAGAYGIRGLGIDISPFCVAQASSRLQERRPQADVLFEQMDGADFEPEEPHSFMLASCIGASWVFGGHGGTLDALIRAAVIDGWVVVGEPYWLREPSEEYLLASGCTRESFSTHLGNVEEGERRGLELVHTLVSSKDDWDRYEGLQWYAAADYARSHADDPDVPELVARVAKERELYLRWGRDTFGWAIYVFRRRPDANVASTEQQGRSSGTGSVGGGRLIELREITKENFRECIGLSVAEHQRGFVASNMYSLAEAKADGVSNPLAIYAGDTMVGFTMYCFDSKSGTGYVDRLMVAADHQKRGYGRAAMSEVIERLRAMRGCRRIRTSFEPTNAVADALYESLGFRKTGEVYEGELVTVLDLADQD